MRLLGGVMRFPAPLTFGNWLMTRADDTKSYDVAGSYTCCLIHGCYLGVLDGIGKHGQKPCINELIIGPTGYACHPRLYADRRGPEDLRAHMLGLDPDGAIQDSCWASYLDAETFLNEVVLTEWSDWCDFLRGRGVMAPILGEPVTTTH